MKRCIHFKTEQVPFLPPETRPSSLDQFSVAKTQTNIWCDHPDSPRTRKEYGTLSCGGDKDKCPIT